MTTTAYLGIDAGTTNLKVAVVDDNGQVLGTAQRGFEVLQPRQGWHEIHPDSWWDALVASVRQVMAETGIDSASVRAIGVSGIGCTPCNLDRDGNVLGNAPTWADSRAEAEVQQYTQYADEILARSGSPLGSWSFIPKLWWWQAHHPALYERIWKTVQPAGYLVYRLTGDLAQEVHTASLNYVFDLATETWNADMAAKLDVDVDLFPRISKPLEPAGNGLSAEAADLLGLQADAVVINTGGDPVPVSLGVGVYKPGQTFLHTGTGSTIGMLNDQRLVHPSFLTQIHILPNTSYLSGLMSATGASMQWARDKLVRDAVSASNAVGGELGEFEIMSALAGRSRPGANGLVSLPYIFGRQSPTWDAETRGTMLGLSSDTTRGDFVRAVMEGVAYEVAANLPVLAELGSPVTELRAGGGPTKDPVWCQVYADVTGVPLLTSVTEGDAAIGGAWMAAVAAGDIGLEDCVERFVRIEHVYEPRADIHARHREVSVALAELYPALRRYYRALGSSSSLPLA